MSLREVCEAPLDLIVPAPGDLRPYVALEHLAQGTSRLLGWSYAEKASSTKASFRRGDILFGKLRPNLRKAVRAPFDGICSTDILVLRGRSSKTIQEYLEHLVHWHEFQSYAVNTASGTKMPRTSWNALSQFTWPLPPVVEQEKIAAVLSSLNEAHTATQAVIEQLQVVKEVMLEELLSHEVGGGSRLSKNADHNWGGRRLDEIAEVRTGIAKGKIVAEGVEAPYLRVANVQDGYLDLTEVKTIRVTPNMLSRYALKRGDVLFTEGGDADKLGRGTVWRGEIAGCIHQNHVFAVRPDTTVLTPEFLAAWASTRQSRAYFLNCSKQTTNLASINSSQLKAFPVILPDIAEQRQIVDCLSAFQARIDAEKEELEVLGMLRNALLPALLTGEIRVPVDSPPA